MNYLAHLDRSSAWPTDGDYHVPSWVYPDPSLFDLEMERFHHGPTWNFVGLECEVAEPGQWQRSSVGLQSVIVVRDKAGAINVL